MYVMKKMKPPLVTVCLITHDRKKEARACLESIYKSTLKDFEVLLFDNNSKIKFHQSELKKYTNLRYVYNDINIGGAGGRSICEKKARGKYLLMLDDDTLIEDTMIEALVKVMEKDSQIGISAPKNFFYDGGKTDILLGGLGKFSFITTMCSDRAYNQKDCGQFEKIEPIDYAQNGFMIRRNASRLVGGHDARLFMTYMETDLFRRVQKAGYKTLFIPGAKLWHRFKMRPSLNNLRDNLGLESPARIYYNMRNRSVIMKRHAAWYAKIFYIGVLVHLFFLYYFYKFLSYKAEKYYFINLGKGYVRGLSIFCNLSRL